MLYRRPMTQFSPRYLELQAAAKPQAAEQGPQLCNHLPMILVALRRLGASDDQMSAFAAAYNVSKGLTPAPPPVAPIDEARWTAHLEDRTRESDYRAFFVARADRLDGYLDTLLPGIAASALHGLMRLAYADLEGDREEAGTAIGYWAATHLALGTPTGAAPVTQDPLDAFARLRAAPWIRAVHNDTTSLWRWMRETSRHPGFSGVADWLKVDGDDALPRLAAGALAMYAKHLDLITLHMMTSLHWYRLIRPRLRRPALALRHLWQAYAAVYPRTGLAEPPSADEISALRALPCPDWPDILRAAHVTEDDHDVSLTFSAREEQALYGDRLYQVAAAKRLGLI
jgi:hypothetical protein